MRGMFTAGVMDVMMENGIDFDGVIGQDAIVKTLTNQIKSDKIGHAYLFCGTRGTGKTTLAKIFARAVNCTAPVNGSPCGKCERCLALKDPSNLDITEIDAASNNGVDEMRDLREKVQYPPVSGKYKILLPSIGNSIRNSIRNSIGNSIGKKMRQRMLCDERIDLVRLLCLG